MWDIKNGGPAKFGSSPYQARAFKLLKNFDFFRSFLMNECSVDNVEMFRSKPQNSSLCKHNQLCL